MIKFFIAFVIMTSCSSVALAQIPKIGKKDLPAIFSKQNMTAEERMQDSINNTFEHLAISNRGTFRGKVERVIIPKGDSTRVKYVWNPRFHEIIIDGVRPTPEESKKGELIVTIWPEKTRWVKVVIASQYNSDPVDIGHRVIVVPRDKYKAIIERESKLAKSDYSKLSKFLDSLAGGTYKDFATGRKK
jgi:hypothetical protein